jgi:sugar phosphate isomerase/epimerase
MKTTRRAFIKRSGTTLASATLLSQIPLSLLSGCSLKDFSFGFQVWTIRERLFADFAGTLKAMSELGYSEVEMCSPLGYSGAGFEPLNQLSGVEMKHIIEDNGLKCTSSHFTSGELNESLDNRIQWAQEIGMKQMILSSFWLAEDASVDDYRKAAEDLNLMAEKTKAAGIQMGFHNHHMEFEKRGNELIYDALLETLDPELVKMQFQVAVVDIGYQAADYFRNNPGRFISAHLADYSPEKESQVPIGEGMVDWPDFFKAAKVGGVKNFYVEMDPDTFKPSADFLKKYLM